MTRYNWRNTPARRPYWTGNPYLRRAQAAATIGRAARRYLRRVPKKRITPGS